MAASKSSSSQSPFRLRLVLNDTKFNINIWFILGIIVFTSGILLMLYISLIPLINNNDNKALNKAIFTISALVLGIIGAVLIYISFREQVRTNKFRFQSLHEQREWDLLYRLYEELKDDLRTIQSYYGGRHNQSDILESFMSAVLEDKLSSSPYPDLGKYLDYTFKQFTFLSLRISKNEILGETEKVYLVEKVRQIFNLYFETYYSQIIEKEFTSKFSTSFKQNMAWGGQAIISLNALSIDIIKQRYKKGNGKAKN